MPRTSSRQDDYNVIQRKISPALYVHVLFQAFETVRHISWFSLTMFSLEFADTFHS